MTPRRELTRARSPSALRTLAQQRNASSRSASTIALAASRSEASNPFSEIRFWMAREISLLLPTCANAGSAATIRWTASASSACTFPSAQAVRTISS